MNRNQRLINSLKRLSQQSVVVGSSNATVDVYAAVALALWENIEADNDEDKAEQIEDIIRCSQAMWNKSKELGGSIVDVCEEITGLDFRYGDTDE